MVESLSTVCLYFFASVFKMNMLDLANLLDNDGNMQNEMMVMAFAATLLSTIPVLLGNEFDVNVGMWSDYQTLIRDEYIAKELKLIRNKQG